MWAFKLPVLHLVSSGGDCRADLLADLICDAQRVDMLADAL